MARKSLSDLSAEELYEMARLREEQEEAEAKEATRAQIDELKAKRRDVVARQRKELAAIDAEIRSLGGRAPRRKSRSSGGSVTDQVMEIVGKSKKITTKQIKAELDKRGVIANNLAQTLAYLKRQGKVTSPARSVYSAA
ncbi:hypothetical protein [Thiosocius teredinicola]|uniref:hypothetical protein n=1 Tax=Thiosocius teredinicola TaxID=1973002 RepID=UPI0009913AAA